MRLHPLLLSTLFLSMAAMPAALAAEKPVLTIYTYNSFTSEWGPGPVLEKAFEGTCGCDINWVALEDGAALLARLKLEGKNTKADVVLGLDTNLTAEAKATGLIAPHGTDLSALTLPIAWNDAEFVPYDWGYFAFVYDSEKLKDPPKSLADLIDGKDAPKVILEDPRTSTPGLGLVMWLGEVYGDKAGEAWAGLKPKILTVSKGWSEAYGLFTQGEAPMVLSYTTSPAYHQIVEKTDRYKALVFPEGNYMQVEVAAAIAGSAQADLAKAFLAFLVSPEAQKVIPTTNYMYPVRDIGADLPAEFVALPKPEKSLLLPADEAAKHRDDWIKTWVEAVSQ
ncbi:thiamine ABC transporter substrate binding subunit [Dongia rigui]|uniref:Thiamine-binding periplasmic protein n=1 Tax=Dongia rigui TaxID=940149 RepID=A0ABU5DV85_9PROT|nr:thiamine ABC transporter substrate binding subunit [Dongia rigui]MDY0871226.1 thiamine ABC transporter substrate binding subunit [Dongia rigui]